MDIEKEKAVMKESNTLREKAEHLLKRAHGINCVLAEIVGSTVREEESGKEPCCAVEQLEDLLDALDRELLTISSQVERLSAKL